MRERTRTSPPKTSVVRVRMSEYERALVRELAFKRRTTMSAVILDAIEQEAHKL